MKKYLYPTLFIFIVFFLLSFFSSYYYFSENYSSKEMVKVEGDSNVALKGTQETSEPTKVDKNEKLINIPPTKTTKDKNDLPVVQIDKPLYQKEVFLTIDDGPSLNNTLRNLKTLKSNGVKATFFVIGKQAEQLPQIIKELKDSGMCIENHSYSHNYSNYKSEEKCLNDFAKGDSVLEKLIDKKASKFIRFPGGSDNQVSNNVVMSKIRKDMVDKGLYYVDWNVSGGDAEPIRLGSKAIAKNIIDQCSSRNFAVVLIHDAEDKKNTADALDTVIKDLKNKGFIFRTFDDITPTEINEMIKLKIINR